MPSRPDMNIKSTSLRRERTGIHSKLVVLQDGAVLAYDTLNIERDRSRADLARAAATALGDPKALTPVIKLRIDQFCARAWEVYCSGHEPRMARGSTTPASATLIEPYVTDSRTILFAPGGAAKSWLALIWSLTLHHGLVHPWTATDCKPVLWLDFEDTPQAFDSRLRQAAKLLGCPDELPCYHFEGQRLVDVWDPVRAYLDKTDVGLIVVDSISRLGLGKLVDDQAANASTDLLNRLEVPWLALAHTARGSGGEHVFGSAHFEFGARVVIKGEPAISPEDDGLIGLRLEVTKANHIRRGQVQTWAFRFAGDELVEHRPAHPSDFPDMRDVRPVKERVRDYLRSVPTKGASATEIADFVEASERHIKRILMDAEGYEYERVNSGGGRGMTSKWRPVTVSESVV